MNKSLLIILFFVSIWGISCSSEPEMFETVVKGKITVSDSLDQSGDYSGIELTILHQDSANNVPDTLMNAVTSSSGEFSSQVKFSRKQYYRIGISRNGALLGSAGIILADYDTVEVNAELPDLENTITFQSNEHKAMDTFNHVESSFQHVSAYIRAGAIPDSALAYELDKWSNLFWEVFERHPNTIASLMAAEKSAVLLNGWHNNKMAERVEKALSNDYMIPVAIKLVKPQIAQNKGFKAADRYLDSLAQITESELMKDFILRDKIKMHFDSSRIQEAKLLLVNYEEEYTDNQNSQEWAKRIRYELNYLAPGVQAPDFEFISLDGDTVSNKTLKGNVYIIEISPLANPEYQNDIDRTVVIHEIYKNYGLKIVTIPLDNDPVTVDAFFSERRKIWPIAEVGSFDIQKILKKFNVSQVPTRLLIDENGVVIRKYVRGEFQDVIDGLNKAFQNNKSS